VTPSGSPFSSTALSVFLNPDRRTDAVRIEPLFVPALALAGYANVRLRAPADPNTTSGQANPEAQFQATIDAESDASNGTATAGTNGGTPAEPDGTSAGSGSAGDGDPNRSRTPATQDRPPGPSRRGDRLRVKAGISRVHATAPAASGEWPSVTGPIANRDRRPVDGLL